MLSEADHWRFLQDWAVFPVNISNGTDLHTLLTCAFLHGSWFHLGSNMLFLWVFGDNVEDVMGHAKYLAFYLLTAGAASLAQVLTDVSSTIPMVGASGAVSGLLAAYIVLFPHGRIRTILTLGFFITVAMLPAWMMIGYWFLLQVLYGALSLGQDGVSGGGTAFFAHIGGFVAGLALVKLFASGDRVQHQRIARSKSIRGQTWGMGGRR
jgi:membrane associated rhomboid family serine protease